MNFSKPFAPEPSVYSQKDCETIGRIVAYGHPSMPWESTTQITKLNTSGREFICTRVIGAPSSTYEVRMLGGSAYDMYLRLYTMFTDIFIMKSGGFMPRIVIFSSMPADAHSALDYLVGAKRCKKVVFYLPLYGEFSLTALQSCISANTVLVSAPLLTDYGRALTKEEIAGLIFTSRSQFHTPLHIDVTIAVNDRNQNCEFWNSRLEHVPIISADCSYIAAPDSHFICLHKQYLLADKDNNLHIFTDLTENHLAHAMLYMKLKAPADSEIGPFVTPTLNEWQADWLNSAKVINAALGMKILRLTDVSTRGLASEDKTCIIVVSDHNIQGWANVLVFFAIKDMITINCATVSKYLANEKKEYVHVIDLSKRCKYENKLIGESLRQCFVLTNPCQSLLYCLFHSLPILSIGQKVE